MIEILAAEGDLRTGEIVDKLFSLKTNKKTVCRNELYKQPMQVMTAVLCRKPIMKIGFDASAKQIIWGIRDSD